MRVDDRAEPAGVSGHIEQEISIEALQKELNVLGAKLADAQELSDPREVAVSSLMAAVHFIKQMPPWDVANLWAPFFNLATALDNLKYGTVAPVVRASKLANPNRHPNPAARKLSAAVAIHYVEVLMENGEAEAEASNFVASLLAKQPKSITGKRLDGKTLRYWRGDYKKLPVDDLQRMLLEELRATPGAHPPEGTRTPRDWVTAHLPLMYRDLGKFAAD